MLPEDQKRILGYFIEEAKDHLNTIEQGLLNLAATVDDSEMMNEVFRAAHSVKGGAAMLGLNSITRTSHRMEDFFKVIKESPVRPDRDLETMLLQIFDGLQEQLEQLQSPFGLTNEQAQEIMAPLEPIFAQAEAHLESLVTAAPAGLATPPTPRPAVAAAAPHPETSALQLVFRSDIAALLRDMLATFKQPDNSTSRQELGRLCQRMGSIGEQFELSEWCALIEAVEGAIISPQQTYRTLAPVVIKDLKRAQDQVLAGAASQVSISAALQSLLPALATASVSDDSILDDLLAKALNDDSEAADLADLFAVAEADEAAELALDDADNWLDQLALDETDNVTDIGLEAVFGQLDEPLLAEPPVRQRMAEASGPAVGVTELNSLADLFEGVPDGFADIWEDDDLSEASLDSLDSDGDAADSEDLDAEFADLLADEGSADSPTDDSEAQALDDMASLFGYDLDAGTTTSQPADSEPGAVGAVEIDEAGGAVEQTPNLLAELEAETPASLVASVAADSLDDFLVETSPPPEAEADDRSLDDFFDVDSDLDTDGVVDQPATSASARDDMDDFFDAISEDDFFEDDDAHTMPELNLESDLDGSDSSAATSDNGLFSDSDLGAPISNVFDPASIVQDDDREDGFDSAADDAANNFFGENDAFADDPFGELVLENSTFDLTSDAAVASSTDGAEMKVTGAEADSSFDAPMDDVVAPAPAAASPEASGFDAEDFDFEDLESLLESPAPDEVDAFEWDDLDGSLHDALDGTEESQGRLGEDRSGDHYEPAAPPDPGFEDDGFDDLEALLDENSFDDSPTGGLEGGSMAVNRVPAANRLMAPADDEFGDLEKLLEEADQLGGSAPSLGARRAASVQAARRSPRRTTNAADQTMRVSVGHLDTLSNLVGELVVNRNSLEQDQERLRQFLDNLLHQVSQLNDVGQRMRDLYERSLLESSLIANRQAFALGVSSSDRGGGSHATGATFDALEMDRFTGFHTLSQEMIELIVRVREASSDIEFTIDSTDQIARQFRQVTTQLQEGLNKARMVPFGQTADRLPRAVRDISLKCGKEAQLVVEGRDTLIDKMILERLYDPMTHLVNNAITHGIESPEERLATGKGREGTITVRAFYQGNQTVIYIADNGGGINPAVVKAKALKQGLITPSEAQTMTEIEVYDLLFLPGFSTRDQADDFSGRGVGMDVVRTALSDIRGSITIESEVGKGTSFTIRLPLTLSITKALSCVNNQARIAFPMDGVEDMFDVPRERVQTDDQGHACILWRDTLLPFRPLSDLLRFNRSLGRGRVYGGPQDEGVVSMVVLRSASTFIALQVDQVIGEQEIVIKQLEGPVPKPIGIAGATVLGDGRVMPIADVLELIDLASGRLRRDASTSLWTQTVDEEPVETVAHTDPTVLIVDDSITVRELLSMSFNKIGYRVEQARDGQEAWEKLRSGLPCDLVFCDIEMPRMDGLELLSRMQKDSTLSQIPTAMLTSRGADRHRQMAVDLGARGYFTKPYLEEMLLDAAKRMLGGENMMRHKTEEPSP